MDKLKNTDIRERLKIDSINEKYQHIKVDENIPIACQMTAFNYFEGGTGIYA